MEESLRACLARLRWQNATHTDEFRRSRCAGARNLPGITREGPGPSRRLGRSKNQPSGRLTATAARASALSQHEREARCSPVAAMASWAAAMTSGPTPSPGSTVTVLLFASPVTLGNSSEAGFVHPSVPAKRTCPTCCESAPRRALDTRCMLARSGESLLPSVEPKRTRSWAFAAPLGRVRCWPWGPLAAGRCPAAIRIMSGSRLRRHPSLAPHKKMAAFTVSANAFVAKKVRGPLMGRGGAASRWELTYLPFPLPRLVLNSAPRPAWPPLRAPPA